jgi:hypothetical protein
MVAEIIAGITLCNSAYKAIKECIGNAKDVSQIAGHLDQLIDGKKQIDEAVKPTNRMAGKWGKMMGAKGIDSEGSMSLGSIAQEKINQKLAEEELDQVKKMIRQRFGYGIWDEIMIEREDRLEKHKTATQKAKEENAKKWDNIANITLQVLGAIAGIVGLGIFFMFWSGKWEL